jgi:polar amino acid transport system substrate-binding protein
VEILVTRVPTDLVKEFAPTGKLRAAINVGNSVLVQIDPSGTPKGVTIDLARALAERLGVALETIVIDGAGKSFEAVKTARCDIGFLAIEPACSRDRFHCALSVDRGRLRGAAGCRPRQQ